jgi:hypothetical protein
MTWIFFAVNSDYVYMGVLLMLSVSVSKHILLNTSAVRGWVTKLQKKKIEHLYYTGMNRSHFLRIPHKLSAALREKTLRRYLYPYRLMVSEKYGNVKNCTDCINFFNCCLSVHVDNYTIIVPAKCTSLLKAQDITICTFLSLYS